jgi:hypothetical protein
MNDFLKENKVFCTAPWVHAHISPQGNRQLCCISDHNLGTNETLDEFWNNDLMKSIRKKILDGEPLSLCDRCLKKSISEKTYREDFNEKYINEIESILKNTKEDGTYDKLPISIDYRTNICNFKCKMCSEGFSTQIQAEKIKHGIKINTLNFSERKISLEIIERELNDDTFMSGVKHIYWAGGEPLLWDIHWNTLEMLIKKGYSKNIDLTYNSNLSKINYGEYNLIDLIKNFKFASFGCSLDGTGEIGEWIRTNLNFNDWELNFNKLVELKNENTNIDVYLSVTVSTPTLFDLENLYELCKKYNVIPFFSNCFTSTLGGGIHKSFKYNPLSPKCFPKYIIEPLLNMFLEKYENDDNQIIEQFRQYCTFLIKQDFYEFDDDYELYINLCQNFIENLEKKRPHHSISFNEIIKKYPPMFDFYSGFLKKIKNNLI